MAELPSLRMKQGLKPERKEKWEDMSPESKKSESDHLATRIQKIWKGHQTRKEYKWVIDKCKAKSKSKHKEYFAAAEQIKSGIKTITTQREQKAADKRRNTILESPLSAKKRAGNVRKEDYRRTSTIFQVKPKRKDESKKEDEFSLMMRTPGWELKKADTIRFVQRVVLQEVIDKACIQGESLILSKQVQTKFEHRPVKKDVFVFSHEFQYLVTEPLTHSLHCINSLGRVVYLESTGSLQQIDITSEKHLASYFLGVRMPLKYTPIIDMVCDTKSCRVYTLNALWKLEVWSLEQDSSLPLKRVPMVNCEITRDHVKAAYKARFCQAKPSFLSLSDSANQILVVNTSCVDGNIAFVDPISLSILRRIHFLFSEYEVPAYIREAIDKLKNVLHSALHSEQESIIGIMNKIGKKKGSNEMRYDEFVANLRSLCREIDSSLLYDICKQIDINNNGFISLEELTPYIDEDQTHGQAENKRGTEAGSWPEWLVSENKVYLAKQILGKIIDSVEKLGLSPAQAFSIFDPAEAKIVLAQDFSRVLSKLCPEAVVDEIDLITRIADTFQDKKIRYIEFCKLLSRKVLQSNMGIEEVERSLREPLVHKNDLPTLLRKCFDNGINLREIFKQEDVFQQGLIARERLYQLLEGLPLGYSPEDIYEIFKSSAIFDAHGNADYTLILQHDAYVILEKMAMTGGDKKPMLERRESAAALASPKSYTRAGNPAVVIQAKKSADPRKVVIEDMIYIDDFDIVAYTTVFPKSSNIYISHTVPMQGRPQAERAGTKVETQEILKYQFLATLKGHVNNSPPTIYYVDETCCLISGEKDESDQQYEESTNPDVPSSTQTKAAELIHKFKSSGKRTPTEILIWNLQKGLVHMMQANPPWVLRPSRRIAAHEGSILDLTYLHSAQLIVSTSTDQTVRFFDPVSEPYALSDPQQFPVKSPLVPGTCEFTATNQTFREVKRVYTSPAVCYKLQTLTLAAGKNGESSGNASISHSKLGLEDKLSVPVGNVEWVVAMKLSTPEIVGTAKQLQGVVSGYGIERTKLLVPAVRHDDPVPEAIYQGCEEEVGERRKKAIVAFQSVLPHNLEYLLANVALRSSQMNKLAVLFKDATLNRKGGRYVNPSPLKEAFKVLLEIPERRKYGHLMKGKERSTTLSVSEVYFYLKKYSQVHPTNISQVMFAKLTKALKDELDKSAMHTGHKWYSEALNAYAGYIRKYGIDKQMLLDYSDTPEQGYLTREQFVSYLKSLQLNLEETQFESVAHEIDALNANKITPGQLESFFAEELRHYNITMFRRPSPIIAEIRAKALPSKKMRLQEALGAVDLHGDGYITKKQFLEAFDRAEVAVDKETLTYLFDMLGEKYLPRESEKVMSIAHFLNKMLTEEENREASEMAGIIGKISASLAYRGIVPEIVFADVLANKLNLTVLPEKLKEVLSATEFVQRIESLHIVRLTAAEIVKLANYLSVNEKNERIQVIYLRNYLHHIKNASTTSSIDPESLKYLIAVLSGKLLVSETRFKRQCYELADLANNCLEPSGLRAVLVANGILSKHADLFVENMMGNARMNLDDLVARMRAEATLYYKPRYQTLAKNDSKLLRGVPQINFHDALKSCFSTDKAENGTSPDRLLEVCRSFDRHGTGKIKIFHLLNVVKHNVKGVDEPMLAGLQYELTMIHPDELVDYGEFLGVFASAVSEAAILPTSAEERQQAMKGEFEGVLQKIDDFLAKNRIDIQKAFEMFDTDNDGRVSEEEMRNALSWTDLVLKPEEMLCLCRMAPKERDSGSIRYGELIDLVTHSGELVMTFNKQQWASAAKGISLEDQCRVIADNVEQFKFLLQKEYPESLQLVPGEVFINCLRDASFGLSEEELAMVTKYAIRGSKRLTPEQQSNILSAVPLDINRDLINVPFFEQSLAAAFVRRGEARDEYDRRRVVPSAETMKKLGKRREAEMVNKVKAYFNRTGLSFYDYFLAEEMGFLQSQLQRITRKQIAESVRVLKIPLTLQEQRMLQQLEDPFSQNNIPVRSFCDRFETSGSLEKRMKSALERMTAAILLKDIAWDLAFDLFDKENKGYISRENFFDLINYWKLGLTTLEIEIMLQLIGEQRANAVIVTRDMFKEKIINSLQNLKDVVVQKLQQSLMLEMHERLLADPLHSLPQLFASQSVPGGIATSQNLRDVLDSMGIRNVTKKELQIILEAGGVHSEEQETGFVFASFCSNIERAIDAEVRRRGDSTAKIVEKLFIVMRAKKMSIFDSYCQFDVFLRGGITRLELMSGLQSMGIESSQENINILWSTVMNESGAGNEKMTYRAFLYMFVKRGFIKVAEPESTASIISAEFSKKLRECEMKLDSLFNLMDTKRIGKASRQEFAAACKKAGVGMGNEDLQLIYDVVEDKQVGGVTYKGLADFVQEGSKDEDKLILVYTRMNRVSQRRKVDWDTAFKQEKKDKKQKSATGARNVKQKQAEDGLDSKDLTNCIRKQRLGMKAEEIEQAVTHLIYNATGTITTKEFEAQIAEWVNKYIKKREEKIGVLKSFIRKLSSVLRKPDAKLEAAFSEMDKDEDGALTSSEFASLLSKLGLDISAKDATVIFGILVAEGSSAGVAKLRLETLRKCMTSFELVDRLDTFEETKEDDRTAELEDEKEIVLQKIRAKLEEKSRTLQQIMAKLKLDPTTHITVRGMKRVFENVELTLLEPELNLIDGEIRRTYGQEQYSYQVFLDFMVRKKVDSSEIYSGLADPGVVFCLQSVSKALKRNGVDHLKAFEILSEGKGAFIAKMNFLQGIEGMQLGLTRDDITALFSSMDKTRSNTISKANFLQSLVYASQATVGIQDSDLDKKTVSTAQNVQNMKVNHVMKQLGDKFEKAGYSLRQVSSVFDVHGTGVLTKGEFTTLLRERDIAVSLNDVRILTNHFANLGDGKIYTSTIVSRLQEIMNQDTEGLYSLIQAKPVIKKIQGEIEGGDISALSDEILKYDKQIGEDISRSGIEKKYFYKILAQFKVCLSEVEKTILNTAFELSCSRDLLDTRKIMPMLESMPEGLGSRYSLEWEQKIYRKIGDFLRKKGKTLMDCFDMEGSEGNGYATQEELMGYLRNMQVNLSEKEITTLLTLSAVGHDGRVKVKDFVKKFYDAYLLEGATLTGLTKEEEAALVVKVIHKIKEKEGCTCERAFAELDKDKIGYLTAAGLQFGLPKLFGIHFTRDQLLVLIKYMNVNGDGVISLKEFTQFFYNLETKLKPKEEAKELSLEEVFSSILAVLKERHLTLLEVFEQLDVNQNGYISLEEFVNLLQTIGYVITEAKAGDLFRKEEPNFDGKISYMTLCKHLKSVSSKYGLTLSDDGIDEQKLFAWRDRAIESLIRSLNTLSQPYESYFEGFDTNKDGVLSPREFRESLRSLKSLSPNQAERLLAFLASDREHQPCVILEKLIAFLRQYSTNPLYTSRQTGAEELLVDEDLFVCIVQHFDGFNVLNEKTYRLNESATYMMAHKEDLKTRGCAIVANNSLMKRLLIGTKDLALSLRNTLIGVSNTCLERIKEAARETIIGKERTEKASTLSDISIDSYKVPEIDPRNIHVDKESKWALPSGCTCYKGTYGHERTPIQIQVYNTELLGKESEDGLSYRRHLELELGAQVMLYVKDPKSTFKIIGKYEKKTGIGEASVELYIVFEDILATEYVPLDSFLASNGGLLQMPLLKGTEAALYIAKMWAQDILHILSLLHTSGFVMRSFSPSHLYLSKTTSTLRLGHCRGIGRVDVNGKVTTCPDLTIHFPAKKLYDNPYLAPEHLLALTWEHTSASDTWSFGSILFAILTGTPPQSYYKAYKSWTKLHTKKTNMKTLPLIEPSPQSFIYDPISALDPDTSRPSAPTLSSPAKGFMGDLESTRAKCENTVQALKALSYSGVMEGRSWLAPFKFADARAGQEKKTVLGLMFDVVLCCLDVRPQNRPDLRRLLESKVFTLDHYERASAAKFARSVPLYKSPSLCISEQCKLPLRNMCVEALKHPEKLLLDLEGPIISLVETVAQHIHTITTPHTDSIQQVLLGQGQGASPHAPLARQLVRDKVVDMLIFLCHRYTRQWMIRHQDEYLQESAEAEDFARKTCSLLSNDTKSPEKPSLPALTAQIAAEAHKERKKFIDYKDILKEKARKLAEEKERLDRTRKGKEKVEAQKKFEQSLTRSQKAVSLRLKARNRVLSAVCSLIHKLVVEMQFRDSVMAPFVANVLDYLVKLMIGEDFICASDLVIGVAGGDVRENFLTQRTFHQTQDLDWEKFVPDALDKEWHKQHENRSPVSYDAFWNFATYNVVLPIYQESIGIGGLGGGQYPVIHEHIQACNTTAEVYSMFGKNAGKMYGNFMVPATRTSEYYSELLKLCDTISILTEEGYSDETKRGALGSLCAAVYSGNAEHIKAAVDLRITRYLHPLLQHPDEELRKLGLLIFYQFSRAIADDETMSLLTLEPVQVFMKENVSPDGRAQSGLQRKTIEDPSKDLTLVSYIYGQTAINNPIDTRRYIGFSHDLPTVHFQQNRPLFYALAKALESPVFSSLLIRLLKSPSESLDNKLLTIRILTNLFTSGPMMLRSLNSAVTDCYLALATILQRTAHRDKKQPEGQLHHEVKALFVSLFELRDPKVNAALQSSNTARDLLRDAAGLSVPKLKTMSELTEFSESLLAAAAPDESSLLKVYNIAGYCKDIKSLLLHTDYEQSPEETEALQKLLSLSMETTGKVADLAWEYAKLHEKIPAKRDTWKRLLIILKTACDFWDWIMGEVDISFVSRARGGRLVEWLLVVNTAITSQCTGLLETQTEALSKSVGISAKRTKALRQEFAETEELQLLRRLSITVQHMFSLLVKANEDPINEALEALNYGQTFGLQLQLQYEQIKISVDAETDTEGMLELYAEQNCNRLATVEYLLQSGSHKLKTQFLKSRFIERMTTEYIKDTRQFATKFNKIDLRFLAFAKSYPLRNEAISIISLLLQHKATANELSTELIQRLNIHQVISHECEIIKSYEAEPEMRVQTALLFFSVLLGHRECLDAIRKDERVAASIAEILDRKAMFRRQFASLAEDLKATAAAAMT